MWSALDRRSYLCKQHYKQKDEARCIVMLSLVAARKPASCEALTSVDFQTGPHFGASESLVTF